MGGCNRRVVLMTKNRNLLSYLSRSHWLTNYSLFLDSVFSGSLPGGTSGKEPTCNVGDLRDTGWIPRSGGSPGGGHGNALQYSCLENPMDRGARRATLHGVTRGQTRLRQLSMHSLRTSLYVLANSSASDTRRREAQGTSG